MLMTNCTRLKSVDASGNPLAARRRYRQEAIAMSPPPLVLLDGKDVDEKQRIFLQNLAVHKSKLGGGRVAPPANTEALDSGASARPMAQEPRTDKKQELPLQPAVLLRICFEGSSLLRSRTSIAIVFT